jgi:hypothetical protein
MFQALQAHQVDFSTGSEAARDFHFAVANATLLIPASLQMFKTPMMFL